MNKTKVAMLAAMLLSSGLTFADGLSGTWAVKATVTMSSCKDSPVNRATTEQWIINPTTDNMYQVQVIGNSNPKLMYIGGYTEANGEGIFFGRYIDGGAAFSNKKGMSDIQLVFQKDRVVGMRLEVKFPNNECSSMSIMDLKKIN